MKLALASIALLSLVTPALADDDDPADAALYHCNDKQASVVVTFKPETEVKDLVTWAMGFSCKQLIFESRTLGARKVTLIAPNRVTRAEAWQLFSVALSTAGLALVTKGTTIKIVDAPSARRESIAIVKPGEVDRSEKIIRTVVKPSYANAETLQKAFVALKSDAGDVFTVGALVVITDFGPNIKDMLSLQALVDVPSGSDGIYTIPVRNADATRLAEKVTGLVGTALTKVLVDDRTNTIVVAGSEAGFLRARALVERLDIALAMQDGYAIHVHRLNHAVAEEVAKTLTEAKKSEATGGKEVKVESSIKVLADKATNSLLVTASASDYLAIKAVIEELDLPRKQVFIEATILELAVRDGMDLGASAHGGVPGTDGSLVFGGVQSSGLSSLALGTEEGAASLAGLSGLVGGLVGSALSGSSTLLGTSIPSYAVLFNAVASSSTANILSAPSIIALDNEEAKYKVGLNIPYQRGLSFPTTTSSGSSPFNSVGQNIDRQDLVLELNIKPHISDNDTVLLEIKHDSKDLGETSSLGPTWTTRTIETRVLVKDQHTIAIGGLMQTRDTVTQSKVPFLGDIPLLGHLFKYTKTTKTKTNLLILLTPYIAKDHGDLERIRERKAREFDEYAMSRVWLGGAKYHGDIDYRKKRGLVEEINRSVQQVEEEITARASLASPSAVTPGVLEVR